MLNRQQRDKLVASLQSVEELWETAAGVNVVKNNIIIKTQRVADDACREDYPLLVVFFIGEYFLNGNLKVMQVGNHCGKTTILQDM